MTDKDFKDFDVIMTMTMVSLLAALVLLGTGASICAPVGDGLRFGLGVPTVVLGMFLVCVVFPRQKG